MWTPDEQAAIERAIQKKVPDPRPCPFCGKRAGHILADGFVFLSTKRQPNLDTDRGSGLPSIALICRGCGTTTLVNAFVLGLQALLQASPVKQQDAS